ncbi:hypothetical protein J6590_057013 [Homalodisca vitripennis]|nr:hypothetical protein J6590_057013 [Homalodisca vitripennis]
MDLIAPDCFLITAAPPPRSFPAPNFTEGRHLSDAVALDYTTLFASGETDPLLSLILSVLMGHWLVRGSYPTE